MYNLKTFSQLKSTLPSNGKKTQMKSPFWEGISAFHFVKLSETMFQPLSRCVTSIVPLPARHTLPESRVIYTLISITLPYTSLSDFRFHLNTVQYSIVRRVQFISMLFSEFPLSFLGIPFNVQAHLVHQFLPSHSIESLVFLLTRANVFTILGTSNSAFGRAIGSRFAVWTSQNGRVRTGIQGQLLCHSL